MDLWLRGLMRRAPVGADGLAHIGARQIYIVPTRMGLFYGLVVFVMLIGSLNFQNNLGLLFTFFLIALGLVAMHHCWFNLLALAVQVRPGSAVFAGESARFEVILRNDQRRARFDLRLGGLAPASSIRLAPLDQRSVDLSLPSLHRGFLPLDQVRIETRHPMGLFRAWCYCACRATVLVYPRPAVQAPPLGPTGEGGAAVSVAGPEGAEDFIGPREYRSGDSPRHLDWKALARERGLIVKQFGGDGGQDLWIDWEQLASRDPEQRICILTRQVLNARDGGGRFGLKLPGVRVDLGRGEPQVRRCLTELALYAHDRKAHPSSSRSS